MKLVDSNSLVTYFHSSNKLKALKCNILHLYFHLPNKYATDLEKTFKWEKGFFGGHLEIFVHKLLIKNAKVLSHFVFNAALM